MFGKRLSTELWPAVIYAVGDIHGCYDELLAIERQIVADAAGIAGEKWIVNLGDHVDRGPKSADVVEHLLREPPEGFTRVCLRGNHEQLMLDFVAEPAGVMWLEQGGTATLRSYGIDIEREMSLYDLAPHLGDTLRARLPAEHLAFLGEMPLMLSLPGWVFVHAGVRPGLALEQQMGEDLIWIREPFLSSSGIPGMTVVHGHTPSREPVIRSGRIGIDTQCFSTGRLTALRVTPDGRTKLFST
jgi:serine/threonine protein phosphatase 1